MFDEISVDIGIDLPNDAISIDLDPCILGKQRSVKQEPNDCNSSNDDRRSLHNSNPRKTHLKNENPYCNLRLTPDYDRQTA